MLHITKGRQPRIPHRVDACRTIDKSKTELGYHEAEARPPWLSPEYQFPADMEVSEPTNKVKARYNGCELNNAAHVLYQKYDIISVDSHWKCAFGCVGSIRYKCIS